MEEQTHGAVLVLKPGGPLVGGPASAALSERMRRATREVMGRVILDLSSVAFVDSAGIEALLDASDSLGALGLTLRLCATKETVREVLRITGTDDAFEFIEDPQTAVRSFL